MKKHQSLKVLALTMSVLWAGAAAQGEPSEKSSKGALLEPGNELIDVKGFNRATVDALLLRESRRISESQFIALTKEENTIVLDTRSAAKFALLHVKGAVHLNFSDLTTQSLARAIPNKDRRILIYCNNNFDKEVKKPVAFESKAPEMALNIPTFITLHAYGYKNIYELGPLLEVQKTKISLVGMKLAVHGN
jgi:hypothetical protein